MQKFPINSRQALLITITLAALALPVGLIIWGILRVPSPPPAKEEAGQPANAEETTPPTADAPAYPHDEPVAADARVAGLEEALEQVAAEILPEPTLATADFEVEVVVADPPRSLRSIGELVSQLGGTYFRDESVAEGDRIVLSFPGGNREESIRRLELVLGCPLPSTAKESPVFALILIDQVAP